MIPLTLYDGTRIDTDTGLIIGDFVDSVDHGEVVPVPTHSEAVDIVLAAQKTVHDLPDVPVNMHPIAAVVSYSLFGLSDESIAVALDCSLDRVQRLKASQAYADFYREATTNLITAHEDEIRGVLLKSAHKAVSRVQQSLNSDNESLAFAAARDVLDRAGYTPQQVVRHQHSMENELQIHVVDRTQEVPDHVGKIIDVRPSKE